MPFINERIPEDFKKSFDFSMLKKPSQYWTPKDLELFMWTVDRERDAFLLHLKSGGRGLPEEPRHEWYAFYYKGDLLYFDADEVRSTDGNGTLLTWVRPNIVAAIEPSERRQEVITLFHEALDAMGLLWNRSRIYAVKLGNLTLDQGGN
jgi:hypothetical protein